MKTEIVTTIRTLVDLDTMTPSHDVDIACDDPLPRELIMAAVSGGLKATLNSINKDHVNHEYTDADTGTDINEE